MLKLTGYLRRAFNALQYLLRGDVSSLIKRVKWYYGERSYVKLQRQFSSNSGTIWGILCTPHTLFIARAMSDRLAKHGISNEVLMGSLKEFGHDFYIVLCPQMFRSLPPADKRVVFQLEQSVSSRWFTPEYLKMLDDSVAILDYSLTNIDFLAKSGVKYPKVHYLPIGAVYGEIGEKRSKKYDFVFYGDSVSSDRRRNLLSILKNKYNVKVCNGIFGEEMYSIIREAKAVINIHYYEGALLEMPRISECISLGVPVLSEGTDDQAEYTELNGAVRFFEENSAESMMKAAAEILDNIAVMDETVGRAVSVSADRFNFMLDRFLVAIGAVPINVILETPIFVRKESSFFVLSLPETIDRRKAIAANLPVNFELFDGIRHGIGWIGCGGSFSAMARYALVNGLDRLVVIEDDASLPDDFNETLRDILEYLDTRESDWDIFSGLMADFDTTTKILSVDTHRDRTYVTMDKMVSTVFNVYSIRALRRLSDWNALDQDAATNTIDRYLSRQEGLRVVVALPFIVGHAEEAVSTLWGFDNNRYTPLISQTELKIKEAAKQWS